MSARIGTMREFSSGHECDPAVWAALRNLQGDEVVRCAANRFGDSELHLSVPALSGLAVGQRYEVALGSPDEFSGDATETIDGQYATIVRTETGKGGGFSVGLRFDHPLMI